MSVDFSHYTLLFVGAVFVNNVVMTRILGLCPFMGVSKKLSSSIGMGLATTFVLTLATCLCYLVDHYLLMPFDVTYLRTLSFIVLIAAVVGFIEMWIRKNNAQLYQVLGIYLPLITTNCAVLGVPLLGVSLKLDFIGAAIFGAGCAIGFTLILILFAAIRERLDGADVPTALKGAPIAFFTAGLMSLAFMGFAGLVK